MAISYLTLHSATAGATDPDIDPLAALHDTLLALFVSDATGTTMTWPTGITQQGTLQATSLDGQTLGCGIKADASGSEGLMTFTASVSILASILNFSGVDNATPLDVAIDEVNNNTSVASIDSNSISPVTAGALIVCILGMDVTGGSPAPTFSTVSGSTGTWSTAANLSDGSLRHVAIGYASWTSGAIVVRGATSVNGGLAMKTLILRPAGGASQSQAPRSMQQFRQRRV